MIDMAHTSPMCLCQDLASSLILLIHFREHSKTLGQKFDLTRYDQINWRLEGREFINSQMPPIAIRMISPRHYFFLNFLKEQSLTGLALRAISTLRSAIEMAY